jgi:AcrR family transcriptional regulator
VKINKQPEVRARTQEDFEEAFWKLYDGHDIGKLKVRAIANVAGHNRTTFYEYFEDIYDLRDKAEASLLDAMVSHITESLSSDSDADFIEVTAAAYDHFGKYFAILLGPQGDPRFHLRYHDAIKPLIAEMYRLDASDPRADVMCECLTGAFENAISSWYLKGKPFSSLELARMLRAVMTRGTSHVWDIEPEADQNEQNAHGGQSAQEDCPAEKNGKAEAPSAC